MDDRRAKRCPVGALAIGALTLLVPACKSPGGPPAPWVRSPDTDSTNVTMRPRPSRAKGVDNLLHRRVCRCEYAPRG